MPNSLPPPLNIDLSIANFNPNYIQRKRTQKIAENLGFTKEFEYNFLYFSKFVVYKTPCANNERSHFVRLYHDKKNKKERKN
jgi:hypothetical protein